MRLKIADELIKVSGMPGDGLRTFRFAVVAYLVVFY